jgi:anti-sigma regulatory factor (Ser/Thr protein kinase)
VFSTEDIDLMLLVADRIALATAASLSTAERSAARILQRSLVPSRLPEVAGLEIAARYMPAEGGTVGGDWYDVFTLPGASVCIVVGDVVGRGLRAAVVMGRLRSALRAYALETRDPAEILARLDRKLAHFEPGEMATVLCAMVEPSLERMHVASAGHLPPVVLRPDEDTAILDVHNDPPIGIRVGRRHSTVVDLSPGTVVCVFTDGLVERRGEPIDVGLERLRRGMDGESADAVCRTVIARLLGGETADDVAVLAVRRPLVTAVAPMELTVPSHPSSLAQIRTAARRWIATVGASPAAGNDLLVALGEACSNAVEHAYGPAGGAVAVRLEYEPPMLVATVTDTGRWRPPRGVNRGRGTDLMRNLADDVRIDHTEAGTTVALCVRIDKEPPG